MIDYAAYLKHRQQIVCQYIVSKSDDLPASLKIWSSMGATAIESKRTELQENYEKVLDNLAHELLNLIEYPPNTFSSGDQAFQIFRLLPFEVYNISWSELVRLCIKELSK